MLPGASPTASNSFNVEDLEDRIHALNQMNIIPVEVRLRAIPVPRPTFNLNLQWKHGIATRLQKSNVYQIVTQEYGEGKNKK
jgi:hypothetical protein